MDDGIHIIRTAKQQLQNAKPGFVHPAPGKPEQQRNDKGYAQPGCVK
ncbi:hypothetical protein J21TS3_33050 [Paenibacillus cookii]|uniref:Transposase IS204/IS1001/IS1096/IS1165 DDE domain-containing protein n=1 Tax=Paenibacillus cookii TaxID=157839 RepID=A0ABQ4LYY1_9BACL|nr:hypothetical protein J21TS3_33050 [Paenibacillus cookii]